MGEGHEQATPAVDNKHMKVFSLVRNQQTFKRVKN